MSVKTDKQWEEDDAVDILVRAEKIRRDKKLFPRVKKAFARRLREMEQAALEIKVAQKQAEIRGKSK